MISQMLSWRAALIQVQKQSQVLTIYQINGQGSFRKNNKELQLTRSTHSLTHSLTHTHTHSQVRYAHTLSRSLTHTYTHTLSVCSHFYFSLRLASLPPSLPPSPI